MSTERRLEEDDNYALSRIGRNSVYSYFVTVSKIGWLAALATFGTQFWILTIFLNSAKSSAAYGADLDEAGWLIFSLITVVFLAKDVISGSKLIYHSSRVRHPLKSRIGYFIGGTGLCSIAGFTMYVSILYNSGISKSNTELIVNSVIIHFVMEMDERVFSALAASNEEWTAHASDTEALLDMKEDIALVEGQIASQQDEIASQQAELGILRSQQDQLMLQQEEVARQRNKITMLEEAVQKMQEAQEAQAAVAATSSESIPQCAANENAAESEDTISDTDTDTGNDK
mmetsp:Transcript_22417/g.33779  ORF Transcript_22417/g.33779 Transcript_22417/m.33779 type:complete len:287 (+) Transcript_22417:348-1208(+)